MFDDTPETDGGEICYYVHVCVAAGGPTSKLTLKSWRCGFLPSIAVCFGSRMCFSPLASTDSMVFA